MTTVGEPRTTATAPQPGDTTLRTAKLTALVCSAAAAIYAATGVEPIPIVVITFLVAPLLMVVLWLQKDSYRTGVGAVQDWGFFLWLGWPVLVPWYAWRTRGPGGWRLALGLYALILSAYATAIVVGWLVYLAG